MNGITRKLITTRNPQANAMVQHAHQMLHNLIALLDLQSKDHVEAHNGWSGILAAVALAMRATVHTTARATPMQWVFGHDAILDVCFHAGWHYLNARRQRMSLHNNKKENARCTPHTHTRWETWSWLKITSTGSMVCPDSWAPIR